MMLENTTASVTVINEFIFVITERIHLPTLHLTCSGSPDGNGSAV